MQVSYYGHSCFGVEIKGKNLLFDPFISPNDLAKHINASDVPADFILISHGHEDHVADAVAIAKRTGAKVICSWEIYVWLQKQGIENVHPMNIGGKVALEFGFVKCVNAIHSNSLPDGGNAGSPMGFVIESEEGNFYYAGDTALHYDMKLIGDYRKIDFAFLPIGDNFTMGPENAIICADFIKCDDIIGMHYDTFGYIKIDHEAAIAKFTAAGKSLRLMTIGETMLKGKLKGN
jgi:L-ascorbate metabolism protein UlaG (beta-lactamase superfamily)